jgi:hypothetical protein
MQSKNKRHLPLNITVLALAAVLWQAEANAQTTEKKSARPRPGSVGNRRVKRKIGVGRLRHHRVRQLSQMRERARLYEPFIAGAARKYGVDPRVLWTIAYLETRFRPELVSPVKARGLMQFMPGTARRFNLTDPHDGPAAIEAAARYVRELVGQFGGRLDLVLASYNAGEGAVDSYRTGRTIRTSGGKVINPRGIKTSGVPPYAETQSYVRRGLLVFSRVTSAGVFTPELIARTKALQSPVIAIALSEQRTIDSELRDLGGMPATMLYSGVKQIGIGQAVNNQVAVARRADGNGADAGAFETVFFDVHSGVRYVVSKGSIVRPVDVVAVEESPAGSVNAGNSGVIHQSVAKSFYIGSGGN